jgi:hypothetical protein
MRRNPLVVAAFAAAAVLAWASAAYAEKPPQGDVPVAKAAGKKAEKGGEKESGREKFFAKLPDLLASELELSDQQTAQVKAAVNKSQSKLEPMQEEMKALREKMRKEMFSMKEGIRENLTMDQKERFDMIISKFMARMMGGGQGMGPGRPGMMGGQGQGMMGQGMMGQGMRGRQGMGDDEGGLGDSPESMQRRKMKIRKMKRMQEPGDEEEVEIEEGQGMMPPPGGRQDD